MDSNWRGRSNNLWIIYAFNRLVTLRTRIEEAFSDIEVQLKRRYDLIPNVIEAVKGYMSHERSVLENVTKARTQAMGVASNATGAHEKAAKENMLTDTLKTLLPWPKIIPILKPTPTFWICNANWLTLKIKFKPPVDSITATCAILMSQ